MSSAILDQARHEAGDRRISYDPRDCANFEEWLDLGVRVEIARYASPEDHRDGRPFHISRFGKLDVARGLLTNIGGNFLAKLLRGDLTPSGTAGSAAAPSMSTDGTLAGLRFFSNANTKLGVGNNGDVQPPGGTAAAATDLDLAGPTRTRLGVASGFPLVQGGVYVAASGANVTVGARQFVVRAAFGSGDHNANWYEFSVSNGGAGSGAIEATPGQTFTMLDHFVSDQGRKVAGQVWEPTITLSWG